MDFYDRFIQRRFERVLPDYQLQALYINANRKKNTKHLTALDLMPEAFIPADLRDKTSRAGGNGNIWSPTVVASFDLLRRRGKTSNGLLAALHLTDLKASGWQG